MEDDFEEFKENDMDEEFQSFEESLYEAIAGQIKQFLIDYFGDKLNDARAETFREIERQIKDDVLLYAFTIPDHLYRHRTITDHDDWDKALADFVWDKNAVYPWPLVEQWYNRQDMAEDEAPLDDDAYDDLPNDAKLAIDAADRLLDGHASFKGFMQRCCEVINRETRLYLERNAAFDLSILSVAGYAQLQQTINTLAEVVAENLHAITAEL